MKDTRTGKQGKEGDRYWIVMGDAPPVTVEQGTIGKDGRGIPDRADLFAPDMMIFRLKHDADSIPKTIAACILIALLVLILIGIVAGIASAL